MSITLNVRYTGKNGGTKAFAEEMISSGTLDKIRREDGNERYEYFFPEADPEQLLLIERWTSSAALEKHHVSPMMEQITRLREKYGLHRSMERYSDYDPDSIDFETIIRERISTRKFTDRAVEPEKLNRILEAGRLAPTAKNLQPQKIFVACSEKALEMVDKVSPCRYGAPLALIVCGDAAKASNKGIYSTYEMDTSIVTTHMMLEATSLGVDSLWVRSFNVQELKQQLALEESAGPACLLMLGYRAQDYVASPLHNRRKPMEELVEYI